MTADVRPSLPAPHRHDPRDWTRVYCDSNGRWTVAHLLTADGETFAWCGKCGAKSPATPKEGTTVSKNRFATPYPSRQTLRETAESHAKCRTLSAPTRAYFAALASGDNDAEIRTADALADASFWEALASCATRAGQSMTRRAMVDALQRLRQAVVDNDGTLPPALVTKRYIIAVTAPDRGETDWLSHLAGSLEDIAQEFDGASVEVIGEA